MDRRGGELMKFTLGHVVISAAVVTSLAALPSAALGQTAKERVVVGINASYQTGTTEVSSSVGLTANAEHGTFSYKFPVKPKASADGSVRVRVIKNIGISVAYTNVSASGTAEISGQIPHPFSFNQLRNISGQTSLNRTETAFHVRATLSSAPGKKLQFTVSAGPTFFTMKQGLVDSVAWTDSYPYDTAVFSSATTKQVSQSVTGFGAGADVAYYFSKNVGIGATASVAKATVSATAADSSAVSLNVGGTYVGLGVRLRF